MILAFFGQNRDYVIFCYGLALILLAVVCQLLRRSGRTPLPWGLLGAFAVLRGLGEWASLLTFIIGDSFWPGDIRLGLLAVSYVFLGEFARLSWVARQGWGPGRGVLLVGLALAGVGLAGGGRIGLETSLTWILGLPSTMGAAWIIWKTAATGPGAFWGKGAGYGLGGYGLAAALGVVVPWLPAEARPEILGLLFQTGQAGLIMYTLGSLWLYIRQFCPENMDLYPLIVRRRLTWAMAATLFFMLAAGWFITQWLGQQAAREERTLAEHYLRQFHQLISAEMEMTRSIAEALAGSARVPLVFLEGNQQSIARANLVLDRFSRAFSQAVCYLMNMEGVTLASSNRQEPDSFVGKSYVFRPYFQEARAGKFGRYLALGATSGERGVYASSPVRDAGGTIVGVAVIKRSIGGIESMLYRDAMAFLIDPQGIIFLSSRSEMVLKGLWPLSAEARKELTNSRQFGAGPFPPVLDRELGEAGQIRFRGKEWFILRQPVALEGWSVVVLGSFHNVVVHRVIGMGAALFLCLTSLGLFMVWDTTLEAAGRLGAAERVYRTVVEGAPDCICLFDAQRQLLAINAKGLTYWGQPEEDLVGRDFAGIWPPPVQEQVVQAMGRASQGQAAVFEAQYCRPDGHQMICQVILNPIMEADQSVRRIVGIATDITERKRAEADLQYRLAFEALITKVSTDFINLRSADIAAGIHRALASIGEFVGVDRAYVFQMHDEGRLASNTFEWCAPGIAPQQDSLQRRALDRELPWFAAKIRNLEVFYVPRVKELPPEAAAEKREFEQHDIQSLIVVPLVHQGMLVGFLGFDAVRQEKSWTEENIILVKMVGDILVNALARQRTEEALYFDEARLEALVSLGQMQDSPIRNIANFAMEEGVRLTRSKIGYLALLNPEETVLTMYAWSAAAMKECRVPHKAITYQVDETGLWGEAVRQRRPIITNDYEAPSPYKKGYPEGHVAIRRHLNVPIFEGSHIVAVVGVGNKEEPYDEADVRQLTLLMDGMWKLVQRRQAEENLAAEKERLAVTLSSIGDAVIATDMEGRIKLMNHVAADLTGWSQAEALDRPVEEVFHIIREETREVCDSPVAHIIKTGEPKSLANNTVLVARDGRERLIADSGAPIIDARQRVIGVVLVFRDVTFKKKTEEELLKMEKLRSLGILAGGIAHDFNNILTGILGNISLAMMYADQDRKELKPRLQEAEKASFRARDLVQQLLTFAKGGAPVKKLAAMPEIVEESAEFALRGSQVRCEFELPEDLWPVEVDEGQISQVVQNLVINASQAMPGGGVITIEARNRLLTAAAGVPLPEGPYVELSIMDQGIGIPPEHLPRIFDPYFSTKQQGSGLGLATVYSIMQKHEGHIAVTSQLGRGTTFTILLPATPRELLGAHDTPPEIMRGTGRVLVMDDEDLVRDVAARILTYLGYEVTVAVEGAEAVELYRTARATGRPFDAVILDLTVPGGMGGRETIRKLQELDPGVKALVSSGYAEDATMTHYLDYGFAGVVQKPYKAADISLALYNLLAPEKAEQAAVLATAN